MRELDINYNTLNEALRESIKRYARAKRDLAEANAFGIKEWKQVAFRQLNHARRELKRACKLAKRVLY
jgi:methionine synthase I (cobalamin-dependent)